MSVAGQDKGEELAAALVTPNAELSRQFTEAAARSAAFRIVAELSQYPAGREIEKRLRQEAFDVVLMDFSSDSEAASQLTRWLAGLRPPIPVIGLAVAKDPQIVLEALRAGASEFLHAPFEAGAQRDAVACLLRQRQPQRGPGAAPGKVVALASAKPGSGASMLACQIVCALRRCTGQKVLLADLDLSGGTAGFYLGVRHPHSVLDALEQADSEGRAPLGLLAAQRRGVEVLPAPATPYEGAIKPGLLQRLIESARHDYEWVVLDLPSVFHRMSLQSFWEADRAFVVSTSELPSLYLARKAVALLNQLGLGKERVQVLLNRTGAREGMSGSELKKIFDCAVEARFPDEPAAVNRAVTAGEPLAGESGLGRALEDFAGRLAGLPAAERRRANCVWDASPAYSGT